MQRLADWSARYGALVESRREAAFAWGAHDCALFASDCVNAVYGVDPLASVRGYSNEEEAQALLARWKGLTGLGDRFFGTRSAVPLAQVGDVGLVTIGGTELLGVCNGGTWLVPGTEALAAVPRRSAQIAWTLRMLVCLPP